MEPSQNREAQQVAETRPDAAKRRENYVRLAHQYEPGLLRASRRMCGGNEDQAQDILQEAFVRGYEAYVDGRFEEGTNAYAWLLRILTNVFLNERRKRQRWEAHVDIDTITSENEAGPEAMRASDSDRPDNALLSGTLDAPLENALASLSEENRLCVILVDIEGMEYAEAASSLNIPIGTVRSRLSRARYQLYNLLYDYAKNLRRV